MHSRALPRVRGRSPQGSHACARLCPRALARGQTCSGGPMPSGSLWIADLDPVIVDLRPNDGASHSPGLFAQVFLYLQDLLLQFRKILCCRLPDKTRDLPQNTDGRRCPSFLPYLSREFLEDPFSDLWQIFHSFTDYLDPSDDLVLQANRFHQIQLGLSFPWNSSR
jgi:hypothetical protein